VLTFMFEIIVLSWTILYFSGSKFRQTFIIIWSRSSESWTWS